ncbi:MAG TPA: response regulator [Opitutaceae bacterium]|jgi:DNA-binding NtrC family response regulator|nr:response regulator [Opitutaceae bacterium]
MSAETKAPRAHIMVVDDELVIRELLESFLTMAGFRVTPVQSAFEAEAIAARDRPDLVITDLQLEESDGLEMVGRLKALLPDTPMILLTGVLFDPKVVREVLQKKVSSYIEKTAPLSRIIEEVQRLLPGR